MAMNYPRILSVALLFLSTLVAFAQPKEPIVVDMDKALTLALQLNADLKLAALEREIAACFRKAARALAEAPREGAGPVVITPEDWEIICRDLADRER